MSRDPWYERPNPFIIVPSSETYDHRPTPTWVTEPVDYSRAAAAAAPAAAPAGSDWGSPPPSSSSSFSWPWVYTRNTRTRDDDDQGWLIVQQHQLSDIRRATRTTYDNRIVRGLSLMHQALPTRRPTQEDDEDLLAFLENREKWYFFKENKDKTYDEEEAYKESAEALQECVRRAERCVRRFLNELSDNGEAPWYRMWNRIIDSRRQYLGTVRKYDYARQEEIDGDGSCSYNNMRLLFARICDLLLRTNITKLSAEDLYRWDRDTRRDPEEIHE
jgi:hypothetical protein